MFDYYDFKDGCRTYNTDDKPPAMMREMQFGQAYVPRQTFGAVYPPEKALMHGTVFPELYMPYTVPRLK